MKFKFILVLFLFVLLLLGCIQSANNSQNNSKSASENIELNQEVNQVFTSGSQPSSSVVIPKLCSNSKYTTRFIPETNQIIIVDTAPLFKSILDNGGVIPEGELAGLECVTYLRFPVKIGLKNLDEMKNLSNLKYLDLSFAKISDISVISNFPDLEVLVLYQTSISNFKSIDTLTNLVQLDLGHTFVKDISFISNFPKLKKLEMEFTNIVDLSPLSNLQNLEYLNISYTDVNSIKPLSNLKNLKKVYLMYTKVSDISPLSNSINLEELNLMNSRVFDITPLKNISGLTIVPQNAHKDCSGAEDQCEKYGECEVWYILQSTNLCN